MRWHSFQNGERPDFLFKKCPTKEKELIHSESGMSLASMSCGQLQVSVDNLIIEYLNYRDLCEKTFTFIRLYAN